MTTFRGRFDYAVDDKGRFNIPAKWRKSLAPEAADTFVLCRGTAGSLWAYPQNEFENFERQLAALPTDPASERIRRIIQSSVTDSELDKQGRVALTPFQMQMAGITKSITLIGFGPKIEIWDTARFEQHTTASTEEFDEIYYDKFASLPHQPAG